MPAGPLGPWSRTPGTAREARRRVPEQLGLVGGDAVAADLGERLAPPPPRRRRPTTFGLPASSRSGRSAQATSSTVTACDRAATAVVGDRAEAGPRTDQRPAAERGVHLVRREGDEVEVPGVVVGAHVDRSVGGELGGVDEDAAAGRVHPLGELVDRLDEPR